MDAMGYITNLSYFKNTACGANKSISGVHDHDDDDDDDEGEGGDILLPG